MDRSRFPSADHLTAWAGRALGNNESAGKGQSGKTRRGSLWLQSLLVEAGQAPGRTKDTYLAARYHQLTARRGKKKATVAVGHSLLVSAYQLLKQNVADHDLGPHDFDERDRERAAKRLVGRLEGMGYTVTIKPLSPAAQ